MPKQDLIETTAQEYLDNFWATRKRLKYTPNNPFLNITTPEYVGAYCQKSLSARVMRDNPSLAEEVFQYLLANKQLLQLHVDDEETHLVRKSTEDLTAFKLRGTTTNKAVQKLKGKKTGLKQSLEYLIYEFNQIGLEDSLITEEVVNKTIKASPGLVFFWDFVGDDAWTLLEDLLELKHIHAFSVDEDGDPMYAKDGELYFAFPGVKELNQGLLCPSLKKIAHLKEEYLCLEDIEKAKDMAKKEAKGLWAQRLDYQAAQVKLKEAGRQERAFKKQQQAELKAIKDKWKPLLHTARNKVLRYHEELAQIEAIETQKLAKPLIAMVKNRPGMSL